MGVSFPEHAAESDERVGTESNADDGRLSGNPDEDMEWIRELEEFGRAFAGSIRSPSDFGDEREAKICKLSVRDRISRPRLETAGGLSQPSVVAIGPFHRQQKMSISDDEKRAIVFLMNYSWRPHLDLGFCFKWMKRQVERARNCYSSLSIHENLGFEEDDTSFAKMLLLDSYFILFMLTVKLRKRPTDYTLRRDFRKTLNFPQHDALKFLDIIFNKEEIALDLLIPDNQIPFFVIEKLFKELKLGKRELLHKYALEFFETIHPRSARHCKDHRNSPPKFLHLLDLFHWSRVPKNKNIELISSSTDRAGDIPNVIECSEHLIMIEREEPDQQLDSIDQAGHIPNATELTESAIVFEKKTSGSSSLDITFRRRRFKRIIGVLDIPSLRIFDYSSLVFYNLIVFEMQSSTRGRCTMAFSALMRNLLRSEEDVRLLRERGILVSSSMDDKQLIDLFERLSRLTENHQMPCDLSDICRQVRSHHERLVSRLCGGIILQYFSKPVVTLSVFVAALLFVPTLLQTIYAMKYHN